MSFINIEGSIFDVDDTLLDTQTKRPQGGLHEESRLAAFRRIGIRDNLEELQNVTPLENMNAFRDAKVHTVDGAVWRMLYVKGIVNKEDLDPENTLLKDIVALKDEVHEQILLDNCKEVPGAVKFVRLLAEEGLSERIAIASMAVSRDIGIFLRLSGLSEVIPANRIISKEMVRHPKPHPEVFELAFETLNLPDSLRRSVYAFEDDPRGIESARLAGLSTCAITTRYSKEHFTNLDKPPDFVADSYLEFEHFFVLKR